MTEPLDSVGETPLISVVVIAFNDAERVVHALHSVLAQECPFVFEVIAAVSGTDGTADAVREFCPQVHLIDLGSHASPGAARNAGLSEASGKYVTFVGSHITLEPGSLAARVAAHAAGYDMVTVCTVNGTDTAAGWASYFLGHTAVMPGLPSRRLAGPPAHCSYVRDQLVALGGFPDVRSGEDTAVNRELFARGAKAFSAQDAVIVHHSPCDTPSKLLRHHFQRGMGAGRLVAEQSLRDGSGLRGRALYLVALYVPRRLQRIKRAVDAHPEMRARYRRVRFLVALGATAAWAGMWAEFIRVRLAPSRVK